MVNPEIDERELLKVIDETKETLENEDGDFDVEDYPENIGIRMRQSLSDRLIEILKDVPREMKELMKQNHILHEGLGYANKKIRDLKDKLYESNLEAENQIFQNKKLRKRIDDIEEKEKNINKMIDNEKYLNNLANSKHQSLMESQREVDILKGEISSLKEKIRNLEYKILTDQMIIVK